ncbi:MAG: hypothetical protein O7A03_05215 [Alphaproteobacteria bacterium]|nr:hypothetical protein [Alphaproteobacteria bacterium]
MGGHVALIVAAHIIDFVIHKVLKMGRRNPQGTVNKIDFMHVFCTIRTATRIRKCAKSGTNDHEMSLQKIIEPNLLLYSSPLKDFSLRRN